MDLSSSSAKMPASLQDCSRSQSLRSIVGLGGPVATLRRRSVGPRGASKLAREAAGAAASAVDAVAAVAAVAECRLDEFAIQGCPGVAAVAAVGGQGTDTGVTAVAAKCESGPGSVAADAP